MTYKKNNYFYMKKNNKKTSVTINISNLKKIK